MVDYLQTKIIQITGKNNIACYFKHLVEKLLCLHVSYSEMLWNNKNERELLKANNWLNSIKFI